MSRFSDYLVSCEKFGRESGAIMLVASAIEEFYQKVQKSDLVDLFYFDLINRLNLNKGFKPPESEELSSIFTDPDFRDNYDRFLSYLRFNIEVSYSDAYRRARWDKISVQNCQRVELDSFYFELLVRLKLTDVTTRLDF